MEDVNKGREPPDQEELAAKKKRREERRLRNKKRKRDQEVGVRNGTPGESREGDVRLEQEIRKLLQALRERPGDQVQEVRRQQAEMNAKVASQGNHPSREDEIILRYLNARLTALTEEDQEILELLQALRERPGNQAQEVRRQLKEFKEKLELRLQSSDQEYGSPVSAEESIEAELTLEVPQVRFGLIQNNLPVMIIPDKQIATIRKQQKEHGNKSNDIMCYMGKGLPMLIIGEGEKDLFSFSYAIDPDQRVIDDSARLPPLTQEQDLPKRIKENIEKIQANRKLNLFYIDEVHSWVITQPLYLILYDDDSRADFPFHPHDCSNQGVSLMDAAIVFVAPLTSSHYWSSLITPPFHKIWRFIKSDYILSYDELFYSNMPDMKDYLLTVMGFTQSKQVMHEIYENHIDTIPRRAFFLPNSRHLGERGEGELNLERLNEQLDSPGKFILIEGLPVSEQLLNLFKDLIAYIETGLEKEGFLAFANFRLSAKYGLYRDMIPKTVDEWKSWARLFRRLGFMESTIAELCHDISDESGDNGREFILKMTKTDNGVGIIKIHATSDFASFNVTVPNYQNPTEVIEYTIKGLDFTRERVESIFAENGYSISGNFWDELILQERVQGLEIDDRRIEFRISMISDGTYEVYVRTSPQGQYRVNTVAGGSVLTDWDQVESFLESNNNVEGEANRQLQRLQVKSAYIAAFLRYIYAGINSNEGASYDVIPEGFEISEQVFTILKHNLSKKIKKEVKLKSTEPIDQIIELANHLEEGSNLEEFIFNELKLILPLIDIFVIEDIGFKVLELQDLILRGDKIKERYKGLINKVWRQWLRDNLGVDIVTQS